MKQVVIVRHAKSVPYGYEDDFRRDLSPRGIGDAEVISNELRNSGIFPDLIISSPAARAIKTARIFADTFEYPAENIKEEEDLYDGISTHEFIRMLHDIPETVNTVYIFGHNPTQYYLVSSLLGTFENELPTCSAVVIGFEGGSWRNTDAGKGKLVFQLAPRMFK